VSTLDLFVQMLENEPGCRSTNPGFPPVLNFPPYADTPRQAVPPYQTRLLISASMDAARVYQLAQYLKGTLKDLLLEGAGYIFMESGASKIPESELFRMMVDHWPPPPPSHVVRHLENLVSMYLVEVWQGEQIPGHPTGLKKSIEQIIMGVLGHGADGPTGTNGPHLNVVIPIPLPPRKTET